MTCPGRSSPILEQPLPQGRSIQVLCCARLMAAGLHLLQRNASTAALRCVHATACFCLKAYIGCPKDAGCNMVHC